jgi:hypothetical protein
MSDDFSPAERAFFESGGKDTAGLDTEIASGGSQTAEGPTHSAHTGQPQTPAGDPSTGQETHTDDDGDGEEVIVMGKDGKPRAQNGRFVPHQALHKERERRKTVETELMTYRERTARADERLAVLNEILGQADAPQGQQQGRAAPQEPINPEVDPIGALNQALQKVKALETQLNQSTTQQSERESARAMMSAYQNDAVRFVNEKPEFKDAYSHLIQGRHRELEAMGMASSEERNAFIANEERQLVAQAFQSRRSPSQMLYNLAVARGFAAKPAAPQQPDHTQRIEQIAKGQRQAGISLSAAGGASGEGLTTAALADMSEEEFTAVASKLGKTKLRQLMGG